MSEKQSAAANGERIPVSGLVGVVIDVSASMRTSLRNTSADSGRDLSRLENVRQIMIGMRERTLSASREAYPGGIDADVEVFIYAFGLRYLKTAACDVLSLLSLTPKVRLNPIDEADPDPSDGAQTAASAAPAGLVQGLFRAFFETHVHDSDDVYGELDALAAEYDRKGWGDIAREFLASADEARNLLTRLHAQPAVAWQLARLLPTVTEQDVRLLRTMMRHRVYGGFRVLQQNPTLLTDSVRYNDRIRLVKELVKQLGAPVRPGETETGTLERLRKKVGEVVTQELVATGDTTMPVGELAQALEGGGAGFASIEDFIYGDTPMRASMRAVADRLDRELKRRASTPPSKRPRPIIVVVSDGDSTDGNPKEYFAWIKSAGVTIVCCYVTDTDIGHAKVLPAASDPNWSKGARLLFQAASTAAPDDPAVAFLERDGWTVPPGARYFTQVNHSTRLATFLQMAVDGAGESHD